VEAVGTICLPELATAISWPTILAVMVVLNLIGLTIVAFQIMRRK